MWAAARDTQGRKSEAKNEVDHAYIRVRCHPVPWRLPQEDTTAATTTAATATGADGFAHGESERHSAGTIDNAHLADHECHGREHRRSGSRAGKRLAVGYAVGFDHVHVDREGSGRDAASYGTGHRDATSAATTGAGTRTERRGVVLAECQGHLLRLRQIGYSF